MHEGMTIYRATDAALWLPYFLTLLAKTYGEASQPDAGLRLLDEAHAVIDNTQERFYEAEVHRVQGALVLAQAADQHALDIARRQQVKSWELRAAMSLARLWLQQGQRAEASALLAPIYGWFTEGCDTPDLRRRRRCWRRSRQDGGTSRRVLAGPARRQEGRARGCALPSLCLHLALAQRTPAWSIPPSLSGHEGARCRASLILHRREDRRPLGLQQHHDEPGRRRGAGVAPQRRAHRSAPRRTSALPGA
jgi:hypothetical protein